MTRRLYAHFAISTAVLLLSCIVGCGRGDLPELTEVTGTITLDGNPVEEVDVMFSPVEEGRPSTSRTDADGHYRLYYSSDNAGAIIGNHMVSLSKIERRPANTDTPGEFIEDELIPPQYMEDGSLTAKVQDGGNVFNFELVSQ
ncbi:hypothetical protein V22_10580 [Calycomorphotria hydatis]|uniref:Nickel uptake substrate-specific transmembrane region n=2 Tax=Calycomorphotria hydatis TaxID=2528027 RepID=A0A517T639_9PLAN|nr:hypothetical protein V22_10580 [Calycomorphotria hydatis]